MNEQLPIPGAPEAVAPVTDHHAATMALRQFLRAHPRVVLLTGAGCSTESGIPDYRGPDGAWRQRRPIQYQDFVRSEQARRRYWARSMRGYPLMARAEPNATHRWVAAHEARGGVELLVTQNVDGLHARAGSGAHVELHGRIADVVCLDCGARGARADVQRRLERSNPALDGPRPETIAPDGDAHVEDAALETFVVPDCERCGGMLKPDVVFFGESVPRERVDRTRAALQRADALLVLGSSLMVFSG
ncbi:MAG: NAD-dependent protein deacetylase, partial [Pseudomonadales bacterium]|nr:NAD-dependent protein deacetylase [Pseudomonadales bacterium]